MQHTYVFQKMQKKRMRKNILLKYLKIELFLIMKKSEKTNEKNIVCA